MIINEAHISLSGYVATQPALRWTRTGVPALNMRVAWTPRRMDRVTGEWIDASTNFLTVFAYRKLAENAATCLRKGDPVVIRGRVTTRDFEDKNGHPRTALEVDAISFGHDLTKGVSTFQRVRPQTGLTANEYQEAGNGGGRPDGMPGRDFGRPATAGADPDAADDAAFASLAAAATAAGGAGDREDGDREDGHAGAGEEDGDAGPGEGYADGGGPGDPGRDMFDDEAVGELAREAAGVAPPF
jgi:single-strand DNA-binding protein